jgi:hypothetical protein
MPPDFVPALELNAGFYRDVVEPIVRPSPHTAALIGYGSELLGFDTERSTDHGWGPRLQIFVDAIDVHRVRDAIDAGLPEEYRGWPVRYGWDDVAVDHHVHVGMLDPWLSRWLGCNPLVQMTAVDWLTTPQQRLLGLTRGAVYHDASGALTDLRTQLHHFPDALLPWLLGCQWRRLWQIEPLAGRAAEAGDDTGSRLVTARIVREIMRLHFLLAREYWPYDKWFGSAYRRLPGSDALLPHLEEALGATGFARREDALVGAYETIMRIHNATGVTEPVEPAVSRFHERPFRVPDSDRFVRACLRAVVDDEVRALPLIGSVDQVVDTTDVLEQPAIARVLRVLYGG